VRGAKSGPDYIDPGFHAAATGAPGVNLDSWAMPPELLDRLAAATRFRDGLARFAADRPVHGECGGFMVLGRAFEDADGVTHEMTGLLGHVTSFARRKMNLGYRQARLLADSPIGPKGATVRGHEFHYSRLVEPGNDAPLAELADGLGVPLGPSGARRGRVSGSFFHTIAIG